MKKVEMALAYVDETFHHNLNWFYPFRVGNLFSSTIEFHEQDETLDDHEIMDLKDPMEAFMLFACATHMSSSGTYHIEISCDGEDEELAAETLVKYGDLTRLHRNFGDHFRKNLFNMIVDQGLKPWSSLKL